MATFEPKTPGTFWGRLHNQNRWSRFEVRKEEAVLYALSSANAYPVNRIEWLNIVAMGDPRPELPNCATALDALWPRPSGNATSEALPPRSIKADRAAVQRALELEIWDSYVVAAIPAIIARVDHRDPEQWAMVGATAGMVADLCLLERKKREASNGQP